MGFLLLFVFYAGLELATYHSDSVECVWKPEASLCIGEGVADSISQVTSATEDYIKENL